MAALTSTHSLDAPSSAPRVVLQALAHRGELAALELHEARDHAVRTVVVLGLAGAFGLLAGFAATLAVAAAVWDRPNRVAILAGVAVADVLVTGLLGWAASRRLQGWHPFAETCRQFHQDCACIHDVIVSSAR